MLKSVFGLLLRGHDVGTLQIEVDCSCWDFLIELAGMERHQVGEQFNKCCACLRQLNK